MTPANNKFMNYQPCIIIPCYNHGALLFPMMEKFKVLDLPIIIVNDGSDEATTKILTKISHLYNTHLVHHEKNLGKGKAMFSGFDMAQKLGYSHVIQIDADGQHNINDIPAFIALSNKNPKSLISGLPIYDHSIPKSRLYSRYITHFWVWIETLSFSIKDSMCGFRIYPLSNVMPLIKESYIGHYMDFDTEIMVKLYWRKTSVLFIPTKVIYPCEGISHFRLLKDNLLISWMHTRLIIGMIIRSPLLIWRKFKNDK